MDELDAQRAFTLQVAERLFLAAEVLSIRAERRKPKGDIMTDYRELADRLDGWAKTDALMCNLLREAASAIRELSGKVNFAVLYIEKMEKRIEELQRDRR